MNCPKYMALSEQEKKEYETKLLHAVRSNCIAYEAGNEVIEFGEEAGTFEGVKIGHDEVFNDNQIT